MDLDESIYGESQRFWNAESLEMYVLSVVLHNKTALAKAMSELHSMRDFKDPKHQKAFSVLEARYQAGENIDPVIAVDVWTDMGIYASQAVSKQVASAFENDTDYEPKIKELHKIGGVRQARKDISKLNEETKKDVTPEHLSQMAFDMAVKWNSGTSKKYYNGAEIEELEKTENLGEHLRMGIPLLDDKIYRFAGQQKGTVKATIFREKHGKTRHACWEAAQDLRQGRKVLYCTLEGSKSDIKNNVKEVLQHEWDSLKYNFLVRDGAVNADELQATIIEAVFSDEIEKVVIDYLHIMEHSSRKYLGDNENSNRCCQQMTQLAVKYDLNMHILNQARQSDKTAKGYKNTPQVYDCYGSNQLIKDASIILVGIRPKNFEELLTESSVPPYQTRVKDPNGNEAPINSVFVKPILSRKKLEYQHRWIHFTDSDEGLKIYRQELL